MPDFKELQPRTPISDHMYHAEVLGLAKTWLQKCKCVKQESLTRDQYPTRLINLAELKKMGTIDLDEWKYHGAPGLTELQNATVNLVDSKDLDELKLEGKTYVTLSHKWGGTDKPVRLTKETQEAYRRGVTLGSLPKTFQDASKQLLVTLFTYLRISICHTCRLSYYLSSSTSSDCKNDRQTTGDSILLQPISY